MNPEENTPWQYKPDEAQSSNQTITAEAETPAADPGSSQSHSGVTTVSWTASEYIEHQRGGGWYGLLFLATLVLTAGVYLLTKDYFATGTMVVVGIIVGIFATHKPKEITYQLTDAGLRVGDKFYPYSAFKSFAILREGALNSVNLLPIKRFMPPLSAYFAQPDEEPIVKMLGEHLPYEERKLDTIDKLSRRLRF